MSQLKTRKQETVYEQQNREANHWLVNMIFDRTSEEEIDAAIKAENLKYHELMKDDLVIEQILSQIRGYDLERFLKVGHKFLKSLIQQQIRPHYLIYLVHG